MCVPIMVIIYIDELPLPTSTVVICNIFLHYNYTLKANKSECKSKRQETKKVNVSKLDRIT